MKCKCCNEKIRKRISCTSGLECLCDYCYHNCPAHRGYCNNKKIIKNGVRHKVIERNIWGVGKALCSHTIIHPANSEWIWKEVTCKRCLRLRHSQIPKPENKTKEKEIKELEEK